MTKPADQQETNWMEPFRAEEERGLNHFFKLHYRAICYFATRMIQDAQEAKDIAAVTFVKLWERRDNFDSPQAIKAFLYISCRNACLNFIKALKRKSTEQQYYMHHLEELDVEVLNTVVESEFLNGLQQEVDALPEQCRRVFSMLYFEGKRTYEIALEMDLSVKTVRNYKARAIEILHNAYLKKGVSEAFSLAVFIFLNKK